MANFEYKVVPAPTKGVKAKGVKTPEGRFAHSIQGVLNEMGAAGWEYLRAELLPSDERSGLTGTATHWRNVLVFRRARAGAEAQAVPETVIAGTGLPPVGRAPEVRLGSGGVSGAAPFPPALGSATPREGTAPPVFASRPQPGDAADDEPAEYAPAQGKRRALSGIEKVIRRNAEQGAKKPG